ncbi:hypothetical protein L484_007556 [Morus notabilis]|uniref:Uncharacterized protein n=1 Tax=Morus notabilis TaxID=981085 RepID=W9SIZ6_9ROSA|nr:hypothetical protein L484_007556 [Morus notabilis]
MSKKKNDAMNYGHGVVGDLANPLYRLIACNRLFLVSPDISKFLTTPSDLHGFQSDSLNSSYLPPPYLLLQLPSLINLLSIFFAQVFIR